MLCTFNDLLNCIHSLFYSQTTGGHIEKETETEKETESNGTVESQGCSEGPLSKT